VDVCSLSRKPPALSKTKPWAVHMLQVKGMKEEQSEKSDKIFTMYTYSGKEQQKL